MLLIFVCTALSIFSFDVLTISNRVIVVDLAIRNVPISLIENSVLLINPGETLYFDKNRLEESIETYFLLNIEPYIQDYKIEFYYYSPVDLSMCLGDKCQGVEITLTSPISYFYTYKKTMYYQITKTPL